MNTHKNSVIKKGASRRKLNERELHLELRRADEIILTALSIMPVEDHTKFEATTVEQGLAQPNDFAAMDTRRDALNRITAKPDYTKIMLIALCIFLGWSWYTAQQDRDLFMQQIAQGVNHGSSY